VGKHRVKLTQARSEALNPITEGGVVMAWVPSVAEIVGTMDRSGFRVIGGGGLNLVGIRTNSFTPNQFDDYLTVFYEGTYNDWVYFAFPGTTDPGTYYLREPLNVDGTAVMKPGQYRDSHIAGKHRGYRALRQIGPVTVYRDVNRDGVLDTEGMEEQTGVFGLNIHRSSTRIRTQKVGRWSAGCQVFQDDLHLRFLLSLTDRAGGGPFDYTLLTQDMFKK